MLSDMKGHWYSRKPQRKCTTGGWGLCQQSEAGGYPRFLLRGRIGLSAGLRSAASESAWPIRLPAADRDGQAVSNCPKYHEGK